MSVVADRRRESSLSIVIPVYNEAKVIESVIRDFFENVVKNRPRTELIVAEDGSTDGTKKILKELNKKIPFSLISGKERKGYTRAFKDALLSAKTDLILFSDSDGQHETGDVFKLIESMSGYDIVGGYKNPRRDPWHRVLISKVYNLFIYFLFGLKLKDIDAGFKLMRREVVDRVLPDVSRMKYCVMSEFILKAHLKGYRFKEVGVRHYPRKAGNTAIFTLWRLPGIIYRQLQDLIYIRFKYTHGGRI